MRNKWFAVLLLIFIFSLFAFACSPAQQPANFTDDLGRNVRIDKVPQRIVSLSPSNTEIIYALGLEDKLVGVTTFDDYPEAAKSKPKVSEYSKVDIEQVVSVQPDLVLADDIHKSTTIPALEKLGITVIAIFPSSLERTLKGINLIGEATGKAREAAQLTDDLQKRIKAVSDKTASIAVKPRVLLVTWHDPIWTAGSGTILDEVISNAGGTNIASDLTGHKTMDLESIVQRNPDVILVMTGMGEGEDLPYQWVLSEPRLKSISAVSKGRVYRIDTNIFGRTTPRLIDGLEQLAGIINLK